MTASAKRGEKLAAELKRVPRDSEELLRASVGAVADNHSHDLRCRAVVSNSPTIQELPKSVPESTCRVLVVLLLAVSFAALYLLWAKTTGAWPCPQY